KDGPGTKGRAELTDAWWRDRGAVRREVRSSWSFGRRGDLDAVLHIEFPAPVADTWLARNPAATGLTYGYVLYAVTAPGPSATPIPGTCTTSGTPPSRTGAPSAGSS